MGRQSLVSSREFLHHRMYVGTSSAVCTRGAASVGRVLLSFGANLLVFDIHSAVYTSCHVQASPMSPMSPMSVPCLELDRWRERNNRPEPARNTTHLACAKTHALSSTKYSSGVSARWVGLSRLAGGNQDLNSASWENQDKRF